MITRNRIALTLFGAATLGSVALPAAALAVPADGSVKIAEFRFRGPASAADEYVELRNTSTTSQDLAGTVLTSLQGNGNKSTLVIAFPAGTPATIPARGSRLIVNTPEYSLGGYGAFDNEFLSAATGIPDNTGVGLFAGTDVTAAVAANRIDSVAFAAGTTGTVGTARPNYVEGAGIPTSGAAASEQAVVRTESGGLPADTNNNAADFKVVSTTATNGVPVPLGAPGPQNLRAPFVRAQSALPITRFNPNVPVTAAPNRTFTTGPAGGAPNVLRLRRTITNNTGGELDTIRVRVNRISTLNNKTTAQVDLRAVDSTTVPAGVTGTTLETTGIAGYTEATTATSGGGGVNSNFVLPVLPGGLAAGASINVQFEFDVFGFDAATSNQFDVGFFVEAQTDAPLS